MKLTKKMIILGLISVSLVLLGWRYVYMNLKTNSVYYAQQMPRDKVKEPELVMLIDNLGWMKTPDVKGLAYFTEGDQSLMEKRELNDEWSILSVYDNYSVCIYSDHHDINYIFDSDFKLKEAHNKRTLKEIDPKTIDEEAIRTEIHETFQPALDKQLYPPVLNLQWLFNWVYGERFR